MPDARQLAEIANAGAIVSDCVLVLRRDFSQAILEQKRIRVFNAAARSGAAEQRFGYIEGMETFDVLEAYTEKADGRKVVVDSSRIITRDAGGILRGPTPWT